MMPLAAEKPIIPHTDKQQLKKHHGQKSCQIQSLQTRPEKSRRQKRREKEVRPQVIVSPEKTGETNFFRNFIPLRPAPGGILFRLPSPPP